MKDSKNSISCGNIKKKQPNSISPFQITNQRQPQFISSHRLTYESIQEENMLRTCLAHAIPFTNICFTCNFALLCSNCLNDGTHKNHDFRNLQKSFTFMKNNLKQFVIKLQAKFNLLSNLTEQLTKCKIDLFSETEDYKISVQQQFCQLIEQIKSKQLQIIDKIQILKQQHEAQMQRTITQIKQKQNYNLQFQREITQIIQSSNQKKIHNFYNKQKSTLQKMIDQKTVLELQKKIYQITWNIDFQQIKQISNKIDILSVTCKQRYLNVNLASSQQKLNSVKKLIKHRSENEFKNKVQSKITKKQKTSQLEKTQKIIKNYRNQKQRDSNKLNGTFCMTPNQHRSKQKTNQNLDSLIKQIKSPQQYNIMKKRKKSSGKMISMPVSPVKQEKQQMYTSSLKIDAMKKKKFKKNI